jgi:hypothetical protein
MLLICAETNIWNAICDQAVDAKALLASLASKSTTLVISPHITYELARTFTGRGLPARLRHQPLFLHEGFLGP